MDNLDLFFLRLYFTRGLGPIRFQKLLEEFKNIANIANIFFGNSAIKNLSPFLLQIIKNFKDSLDPALECQNYCKKNQISYINFLDQNYPYLLKQVADAPLILFFKGELSNLCSIIPACAVVGTRRNSQYGEKITKQIVEHLVQNNVIIVSGMAMGIDSIAHITAIKALGTTIAVLGTPFVEDVFRKSIFKKILDSGGTIISEYSNKSKIDPGMFIRRNRIIAGMSLGTVIIEAGLKSGALSTAKFALDYNREVFAVPGEIGKENSEGTNWLIKTSSASLIQNGNDVTLGIGMGKKSNVSPKEELAELTKNELIVYNALKIKSSNADELVMAIGFDQIMLSNLCSLLELKGIIAKNNLGQYSIL